VACDAAAAAAAACACSACAWLCTNECIAIAVGDSDIGEFGAAADDEMPLLLAVPPPEGMLKLDEGEEAVEAEEERTERDGLVAAALLLAAETADAALAG